MESRAKAAGHPVHQQLIVFPLGLLSTAVVFDVLRMITGDDRYATAAFFMIAAGLIGGIVAAVFGLIDYLAIPPGTRARRIGLLHGAGNAVVMVLFALSWFLRLGATDHVPGVAAFVLALLGLVLSGLTGWLGGELVARLGVGVDDGANLDLPASFATGVRLDKSTAPPRERPGT